MSANSQSIPVAMGPSRVKNGTHASATIDEARKQACITRR